MRAISILYALFFFSNAANAQIEDKTIYDLTLAIDALDYIPQKRLEGFQGKELKKALYCNFPPEQSPPKPVSTK